MKSDTQFRYLNPNILEIHSELLRIYGNSDEGTQDMFLDIKTNGIMVPLVVSTRTSVNTVVSGARRLRVALSLGIETVPVICFAFPSEEAEKHFILSANRNRPKTKYQQLVEGKEWESFERQKAAIRRQSGLKARWKNKHVVNSSPELDELQEYPNINYYPVTLLNDYRSVSSETHEPKKKQRATDKVGGRIGMSRHSYERGRRVIEKCENLRKLGKELEMVALQQYLEVAGIVPTSNLLKVPYLDSVLDLVGSGQARNIKEALSKVNRIQRMSAVVEGAIFFFPDKMLRKPTYYHLGRVAKIANTVVTVVFRDSVDDDLHEHQYKCDDLLALNKEEESPLHQRMRERINSLLMNPCATATDRYMLNRLLGVVVCTQDEVDWLQFIERRVAMKSGKQEVAV